MSANLGDRVRITVAGDSRTDDVATVLHVAEAGVKAKFDDGSIIGFKHTSYTVVSHGSADDHAAA